MAYRRRLHSYSLLRTGAINMPMGWTNRISSRRKLKRGRSRSMGPVTKRARVAVRSRWSVKRPLPRYPPNEDLGLETKQHKATVAIQPKVLHEHTFNFPSENTTSLTRNRTGNSIMLKGNSIYGTMINNTGKYVKVMMAYCVEKRNTEEGTITLGTNFFRDPNSGTDRAMDFVANHSSNDCLQYQSYGINTDMYHIVWRRSKILAPITEDRGTSSHIWHLRRWTKSNKKIGFNGGDDTTSNHRHKLFYWVEPCSPQDLDGDNSLLTLRFDYIQLIKYRNLN